MKRILSVAKFPGSTGTYYYNEFFRVLNLDYKYEALQADKFTNILPELESPSVVGFSVSMPFKREVIGHLTSTDHSVVEAGSCNTVRKTADGWVGYSTDVLGVKWAISQLPAEKPIQILGDGAMSVMFQQMLTISGRKYSVFSRRLENWESRDMPYEIIINATSLGTSSPQSPLNLTQNAKVVVDLSLNRGELFRQCDTLGVSYLSGLDFYKEVFLRQFAIYIGRPADPDLFDQITLSRN